MFWFEFIFIRYTRDMPLYFIRHGESVANRDGFLAGRMDVPLTARGVEQARTAGRELAARGIVMDGIMSSPLGRTRETARLIAEEIGFDQSKIEVVPLLLERELGSVQGLPAGGLEKMTSSEKIAAGVETDDMLRDRAYQVIRWARGLQADKKNILLVSHSGLGRRIFALLQGVGTAEVGVLPNAEVLPIDQRLLNSEVFSQMLLQKTTGTSIVKNS